MMRSRTLAIPTGTTAPSPGTVEPISRRAQWALHWVHPHAEVFPLEGETLLGRDADSAVRLPDHEVSRRHASIQVTPHGAQLRDLGSSNGTYLDGSRVTAVALRDGAVLQIGSGVAVVVYHPRARLTHCNMASGKHSPIIGTGKLEAVFEAAEKLGERPEPVFIHGETGSGKEAVAQAIHQSSGRQGRCVVVNCATLNHELAAATLFGHVKGAFSGAVRDAPGAALEADGGTLFLDEVGELDLKVQPLLLRLLQSGEVCPVGASRTQRVNVRVVSATHCDLGQAAMSGSFREDLYFRLTTHTLRVPSLKDRKEDIVALFQFFSGCEPSQYSARFVTQLLGHRWPGNVRELQNVALRLLAARSPSKRLSSKALAQHLGPEKAEPIPPAAQSAQKQRPIDISPEEWRKLFKRHRGVAASIARELNIGASSVKRYLAQHGLRS